MSKGGGACQVLFLRKLYRITSQSSPSPKPTPQGGEVKAETSNSEKPWLRSELPQQEDGATTGGKRPWWPWLMEWWCYWWWWSWWSDEHCAGPWSEQSTIAFKHRENAHRTGPGRSGDFDRKIMVSIFLLPSIVALLGEAPLEQLDLICHLS